MSVDMDYIELDSILDECFERMQRGEDLETCLASYPNQVEELRALLIIAQDVAELELPKTSQQATEAGRQRMFTALSNKKMSISKDIQTLPVSIVGIVRYLEQVRATIKINFSKEFLVMHKTVIAIVLVLVVLFGGSAASAYAAQGSLPGDVLYPMKTAIEDASADFSMDSASEVRLYLSLAEKRIAEIESLAAEGRYEDMALAVERFESHIAQAISNLLVVAQGNPAEAEALASTLGDLMERHTQVLLALMADAPGNVQAMFEDAVEASQEGISAATEFGGEGVVPNETGNTNELGEGDEVDNGNLNAGDDEAEEENENLNGNEEDDNMNADDDDDGNINGDDSDTNGDDDDEDENVNGDDDEDENTNGDDDDEDENTNGDDDEDDASNDNDSEDEDENVNGDDEANEDAGDEGEDGMNENGDESDDDSSSNLNDNSSDDDQSDDSEDNSNGSSDDDSSSQNDNTGEEEDSSDDGSSNDNDNSNDDSTEDDDDTDNDNDNSEIEDEESENDNSDINDNTNG